MMMILNQSKNTTTDKMTMTRNVVQNQLHEEQRKLSLAQIIMARAQQVSRLHLNTHVHPTHVAFE